MPPRRATGALGTGAAHVAPALALVVALALSACGPTLRRASDVRRDLEASGIEAAREPAPDLVAAAYAAADEAEAAQAAGDLAAADDHATRARLLAQAALAERERATAERERIAIEQQTIELEEQALRDETAAREVESEVARLAAARAAREELLRALERAEHDEAHPVRRRRVSIGEDAQVRRAALAIRERARLLAAAAAAMGAETIVVARAEELAGRSAGAGASDEALALAEQAHGAAREALASARRARPAVTGEEIASAVEAAEAAGFEASRLERGLGIEVSGIFRANGAQPTPAAAARIARLAALLASHPHGPIAIEVDVSGMGESATRLARQRGEWARDALVRAGVPPERVTFREPAATLPSADTGERVRAVLVAYAEPPPTPPPPVDGIPEQAPPTAHP